MSDYVPLLEALEGHFEQQLDEMPDALRQRVATTLYPLRWNDCDPDHRRRLAEQFDTPTTPSISEEKRQAIEEAIDRELTLKKRLEKWKAVDTPTSSDLDIQETKIATLSQEIATLREGRHIARGDYYPDPPNVKIQGDEIQSTSSDPCAEFRQMENLTADELSFTFVGDKSESGMGANNMLEISARKVKKRIALAALDLVDRRQGQLNSQGAILLGLAQKKYLKRTEPIAQTMTRLRKAFRTHLGIHSDPFHPYREQSGWVPRFNIDDKRGAADERAKREAERRTVSYEQLMKSGEKSGDTSQTHQTHGSETDAEDWMQRNGHSWDQDSEPDVSA